MKRKLFSIIAVLCAAALCTVLFAACGGGGEEDPDKQPGGETSYTISSAASEDYSLTPSKASAEAGEKITVSAESKNADKYITGVTWNGNSCVEEDGSYTFTMPSENVTLAAQMGNYEQVLEDGKFSLSNTDAATMAVNSGEAVLRIDFSQRIWNATCKAESMNGAVIPQDALEPSVHFADGTQADYAQVSVDTSKISVGSAWLRLTFSGSSSSDRGELLIKITVKDEVVLEIWQETVVFDVSDLSYGEDATYYVFFIDKDHIGGSNGRERQDFSKQPAEGGEVELTIEYVKGHTYSITFGYEQPDGKYTWHTLNDATGSGTTAGGTGFNSYDSDTNSLTFIADGATLGIDVSTRTHT